MQLLRLRPWLYLQKITKSEPWLPPWAHMLFVVLMILLATILLPMLSLNTP